MFNLKRYIWLTSCLAFVIVPWNINFSIVQDKRVLQALIFEDEAQQQQQYSKAHLDEASDNDIGHDEMFKTTSVGASQSPRKETVFVDIVIPPTLPTAPALQTVKEFTSVRYEKFMIAPPGKEYYSLLYYLTKNYGDDRPVVDIGTRFAASAIALAAGGTPVYTFDLPHSRERHEAFRNRSELAWHELVRKNGINIRFFNINLIEMTDLRPFLSRTWLIVLDTYHRPYSNRFEPTFFGRLCEINYKGLVLIEDIDINREMKKWWNALIEQQESQGFRAFNVTHVGHSYGTGLLDFSGKVKVEYPGDLTPQEKYDIVGQAIT